MKLEMRTVQKIAAAAMTLAVMFGCASPLKPLAASAAQNTVSVSADIDEENSYISAQDQMYQKDFLKLVNKARAKAGLNSVELGDAAHNAAAAERAEELATTYSYVRLCVPTVSATSPFLPRTASAMCPLARTIWPACPLRTPPWTSG